MHIFIYLFIYRESGKEGEREGEKHQCVVASWAPPTGDLACNSGMCPDWELNWLPFGSQAGTQSTELYQPRHNYHFLRGHIMLTWRTINNSTNSINHQVFRHFLGTESYSQDRKGPSRPCLGLLVNWFSFLLSWTVTYNGIKWLL